MSSARPTSHLPPPAPHQRRTVTRAPHRSAKHMRQERRKHRISPLHWLMGGVIITLIIILAVAFYLLNKMR